MPHKEKSPVYGGARLSERLYFTKAVQHLQLEIDAIAHDLQMPKTKADKTLYEAMEARRNALLISCRSKCLALKRILEQEESGQKAKP